MKLQGNARGNTLRMGRAEVQAGANAHGLQSFHQRIAADAAGGFVNADNKQVPGVLMLPRRRHQRPEGRIRQLADSVAQWRRGADWRGRACPAAPGASAALISARLYLKPAKSPSRLRGAAQGLAVISVNAEAVELQAANARPVRHRRSPPAPPSAQVIFLIAWNEKMAVPRHPTWRPL